MDAFKVQAQIRQNATEMQHYLKDLGSWEQTIKQRDRSIRKQAGCTVDEVAPAPVRSSGGTVAVRSSGAAKPLRQAAKTQRTRVTSATAAGHTYDKGYKKWDKFDVDAALQSDDEAEDNDPSADNPVIKSVVEHFEIAPISTAYSSTGSSAPTPASIVGHVPRRSTAPVPRALPRPAGLDPELEERERGNAHFKAGNFAGAVKSYTRCLGMNGRSVAALSNRAMAQLKLGEHRAAERDCTAALTLEPLHSKSLRRRAAARAALGKHRAALADLQLAMSAEPGSKELQAEAARCKEVMRAALKRCPKKRVPIQLEVLPAAAAPTAAAAARSVAAAQREAVAVGCEEHAELDVASPVVGAVATSSDGAAHAEGSPTDGAMSTPQGAAVAAAVAAAAAADAHLALDVHSSSNRAAAAAKPKLPAAPPKTAYELEREWRNLKEYPDLLCAYVGTFKPSTFKKVFRESLHADVISGVLRLLQHHIVPQRPAEAMRILQSLSKSEGFAMLLMMLPATDKAALSSIFGLLQQRGSIDDVTALRAVYKVT